MTRFTALVFVLLLGCTTDGDRLQTPATQELCNEGETRFFSCATTDTGESFTLCGQATDQTQPEDAWIQFRRKSRSLDLVYPSSKKDSLKHFRSVNASHSAGSEDWIRFSDGKTQYSLVNYTGMDGRIDSRVMSESGLDTYKVHSCKSPTRTEWERFKTLGEEFLERESDH